MTTNKTAAPPVATDGIGSEAALKGFFGLHPSFEKCWQTALARNGEEWAPRMVYGEFARQIERILINDPTADCAPIMEYVETLMRDGNKEVGDTVAMFFIEALLGTADTAPDLMAPVLRLLGPVSRSFAVALNKHMGTKNHGLDA